MIETTILNYLSETVEVPVYMEEPEDPPESYLVLEKTGSGQENRVQSATFAIQSYGASLYDAAVLNENVKEAMEHIATLDAIGSAKLNGDYNFTDPETRRYRYQAVYNIFYVKEN